LVASPEKYVTELFDAFRSLPFDQVLEFSEAEVTDNGMPDREIMEDASKIHMLRDVYRHNEMLFNLQLLREPWYDRWRVHPGSGRLAAQWLEGRREIPGIYIHFQTKNLRRYGWANSVYSTVVERENNLFRSEDAPTNNSILLASVSEFKAAITNQKESEPEYETYFAYPTKSKDCYRTQQMDREWHWHHTSNQSYIDWKFIRWSEGKNFLKHKYNWRSYAIDLWHELNG
jgi:hypothetical protein